VDSVKKWVVGYAWRPLSYKDQSVGLGIWARQIEIAELPYREVMKQVGRWDPDRAPRYAVLTRLINPLLGPYLSARDSAIAQAGLGQTAMALMAHRDRFGSYPASLAELRRKLGWRIPEDPFSGKPFVYKRRGAGFLLYSFGPNLRDDGGSEIKSDPHYGDIVWTCDK